MFYWKVKKITFTLSSHNTRIHRSSFHLGYFEFLTGRYLMVDMPTHLGKLDKVPLDGVVGDYK
jgi:hypothetical protein